MISPSELYTAVVTLGIEHTNHASDLYIPVTKTTQILVDQLEPKGIVSVFKNNKDNKDWYDIAFAYIPFWEKANETRTA